MGIDLSVAGPAWSGFRLRPWGRAKDWRLYLPDGTALTAQELLAVRRAASEIDYLNIRLKELEAYTHPDALHFGPEDVKVLLAAQDVLTRAAAQIPKQRKRREAVRAASTNYKTSTLFPGATRRGPVRVSPDAYRSRCEDVRRRHDNGARQRERATQSPTLRHRRTREKTTVRY